MRGAELSAAFDREAVQPLLARHLPGLRHVSARLGSGSDVVGFDDELSRDHDWGCRLTVLVDEADRDVIGELDALLERDLPQTFRGRPVRFPVTWNPRPVHQVEIATVPEFVRGRLGVWPAGPMPALDWLCITGNGVLEAVGGPVFTDSTASFAKIKSMLLWYPAEVELFVLASEWQRLCQYLPMVGRTGQTGQELQSRLLSGRLATGLMRLAFLLQRQWMPYPKWAQRGFERLPIAGQLPLAQAVSAVSWQEREEALANCAQVLADFQRARGLSTPETVVQPFYDRPYRTVSEELPRVLRQAITDPELAGLPLIGAIEQWVDSADILAHPARRPAVAAAYRAWLTTGPGDPA
jgi:hypothetical protein